LVAKVAVELVEVVILAQVQVLVPVAPMLTLYILVIEKVKVMGLRSN
jgi:hypothetical protein